ncbi:hypothetical protein KR032_009663 [Drosophila birchii]|nr:hypothetical protein KR032_009663 [Drosophila birchii]
MIFLQFWWAVLVFNSLGSSSWPMNEDQQFDDPMASEELESFSRAVDQVGPELQDLWSSFGELPELDNEMELTRERRNAIDSKLAPAQVDGSMALARVDKDTRNWQAEADAWYENFQMQMAKKEAAKKRMIHEQERSLTDTVTDEDMRILGAQADAWYRDLMANKSQKRRERSSKQEQNQAIDQHDQIVKRTETGKAKLKSSDEAIQARYQGKVHGPLSEDNVKLKQAPLAIDQQMMKVEAAPEKIDGQLEKFQESRNAPSPAGVYESSPSHQAYPPAKSNKLDHEANYKLSKIEQEAAEKMPKLPRTISQDVNHFKQKKRRSPGVCDPMEEIKLKTSSRLIAKGFGPLLPSESYQLSRKGKLDEWQNRMFDATQGKYQRLKNLDQHTENMDYAKSASASAMEADLPQSLDYKNPQNYRLYSFEQQKKPTVLDYDRSKRKPKDLSSQSEPSLRTDSHDDQGLSFQQAVGEPSALEDQMNANLYGEEDQRAPQHWMAYNPKLSDVKKATVTREHESKDMVQKLQQEYREDSKLHDAAVAQPVSYVQDQPSAIKGSVEEKLNDDLKAVAAVISSSPEATSQLHDNQETRARRVPRHARRVKRSLGEQHVAARRRAQLLDEDHNGNRVSFGVMGNGLLTPDAEELGEQFLSFPDQELLAYNEPKGNHQDPMENLVSILNQRPKNIYHYHNPQLGHLHKTNFSQMSDLQKFLQIQQNILQVLFEIFLKNEDLLDPTKFKPKTQVARKLLRQYQDLPQIDQLVATDQLVQDLNELLQMAENAVHRQRDTFLYEILDDVFEEYKNRKPSSWFNNYLKVAELLKDEGEQQSWDPLAF